MISPLIHAAEDNIVYISAKVDNVAKQALILLAKTISKLVYKVHFLFANNRTEQRELVKRVFNALGDCALPIVYVPFINLKSLGLEKINDFYDLKATGSNILYAFRGTWEILTM